MIIRIPAPGAPGPLRLPRTRWYRGWSAPARGSSPRTPPASVWV